MTALNPISIIFYVFALIAVCSAISVIMAKHPVRSVLSLVVTFFAMSGVWMLLQAEFLSLILLFVYVGAVMTLFLFVVMMLDVEHAGRRHHFVQYGLFALLVAILIAALLIETFYLHRVHVLPVSHAVDTELANNNLQAIGQLLYTDYLYPFEIAGVILLAAIIAAITLTHRIPVSRKAQSIDKQVSMPREKAVRLVTTVSPSSQLQQE
jgi:NADH-quinone oxidoreductase subunit J